MSKPKSALPPEAQRCREEFRALGESLRTEGLDAYERAFLATCQRLHDDDAGSATPAENFFCSLVRFAMRRKFTPGDVDGLLDAFRSEFAEVVSQCRDFLASYGQQAPETVQAQAAASEPAPPAGEQEFLEKCRAIYRRDFGCGTPYEEFACRVIDRGQARPDEIEGMLADFRENFAIMRRDAAAFTRAYGSPSDPRSA